MERENIMERRELLKKSGLFGFIAASPSAAADRLLTGARKFITASGTDKEQPADSPNPLVPPAKGAIPVAFVVSEGAVVIDFCGPWEVFQDVHTLHGDPLFNLYTVAEATKPIHVSGGLTIVPTYNFQTAPPPKVIVIPAQNEADTAMLEWIRNSARAADITLSVCTGAYILARTGLLSGKSATTHHSSYSEFAMEFPDIRLKRGARFVEEGNLASSGGLSSGIDLALHVVQRYFGRKQAERTADMMEYQGQGWLNPNSNQPYAKARASTDEHPVCPICSMDADPQLKSVYKGRTYNFCSQHHKELFDKAPAKLAHTP